MGFETLLSDSRRAAMDAAAVIVIDNPKLIPEVYSLTFSDDHQISMRASRVLELVGELNQDLIAPYINPIVQRLKDKNPVGVHRNFLKILINSTSRLTEEELGIVTSHCFDKLESAGESIAIHAYCMQILYNISIILPEIKPELVAVIEQRIPEGSSGIKACGSQILIKLYREIIPK